MATSSAGFHEAEEHLTLGTRDMHRALMNLDVKCGYTRYRNCSSPIYAPVHFAMAI
jgi:hypothetical protein